MRSRCLGPSDRIGTHDQLVGGRTLGAPAAGVWEGLRLVGTAGSTGMLIAEAFRLGLTPVYVNGLGVHAKRVADKAREYRHSLIYSKAFPKYAPGKVLQLAPSRLRRTERESAIPKKQGRAW